MTTWDVGRGRGGAAAALARARVPVVVAGVDSDRLYPIEQQHRLAELLRLAVGGARTVRSLHGHDGFLLEHEHVGELVREVLATAIFSSR